MEKDFPLRGIFVSNTYIILDYVDTTVLKDLSFIKAGVQYHAVYLTILFISHSPI